MDYLNVNIWGEQHSALVHPSWPEHPAPLPRLGSASPLSHHDSCKPLVARGLAGGGCPQHTAAGAAPAFTGRWHGQWDSFLCCVPAAHARPSPGMLCG